MVADLFSVSLALRSGTVTGADYDVAAFDGVEVFARGGTASAAGSIFVLVDAMDLDGNWFNAVGSIGVGTSSTSVLALRRGQNIGAANPAVLGVRQRIRTINSTGATIEFGVNVVGFGD